MQNRKGLLHVKIRIKQVKEVALCFESNYQKRYIPNLSMQKKNEWGEFWDVTGQRSGLQINILKDFKKRYNKQRLKSKEFLFCSYAVEELYFISPTSTFKWSACSPEQTVASDIFAVGGFNFDFIGRVSRTVTVISFKLVPVNTDTCVNRITQAYLSHNTRYI
jgi:hypothetical protein